MIDTIEIIKVTEDSVLNSDCYTTTNRKTHVNCKDKKLIVKNIRMDCFIVIKDDEAHCIELRNLKKGDLVVKNSRGVEAEEINKKQNDGFSFMSSEISSERENLQAIKEIARLMKEFKQKNKKISIVVGPAAVHTGSREALCKMINLNYIDLFLGGNAIAVHDIEKSIFNTSLGINHKKENNNHSNHIWTINRVNKNGSIKDAVKNKVITNGIMYSLVKNNVPFVLAGSIRDDGPLNDVITDMNDAQDKTRSALKDTSLVLMLSTMLHSIAIGNMIPASTITICVDINPATVTKLCDRGSTQAIGLVTDVSLFLKILADELE